jgi:galactokinase
MISLNNIESAIKTESFIKTMTALYGGEEAILSFHNERYLRLSKLFASQFPQHDQVRIFSTSGRTEIAGNHTDHQRGHVLCASVDMDIVAMAAPNNDNIIRLKSEEYDNMDVIDLSVLTPVEEEKYHSASLIRGISSEFARRGHKIGGFDAYTTSHVPKGSGLSSSAAFEIMVSTILNYLYNDSSLTPVEMAIISQYSENNFFGKPCGLMDQCGCGVGGVMSIDFKTPGEPIVDAIQIDFESYGYSLIITNTGGSHADLNDDYASITEDMRSVARIFGKSVLSEIARAEFRASIPMLHGRISEKAILRAMHYFADDEKVTLQSQALKSGNIHEFLNLVNKSGISSWTCLQNVYSTKIPTDQPVSLALAVSQDFLAGDGAVRVHGGGFAGTIQAFVPNARANEYISLMQELFGSDNSWKIRIRNLPTTELK